MGPEWLIGAGTLISGIAALFAARQSHHVKKAVGNGFADNTDRRLRRIEQKVDDGNLLLEEHISDPDAHKVVEY